MRLGLALVTLAIAVDQGLNVIAITRDRRKPSLDIGMRWRSDYTEEVARQPGGFLVLMILARILSDNDAALLPSRLGKAA